MKKFRKVLALLTAFILVISVMSSLNAHAKTSSFKRAADKNHQEYEYTTLSIVEPYYAKEFKAVSWKLLVQSAIAATFESQTSKGYYDSWVTGGNMEDLALKFPLKKNVKWKAAGEQRRIVSTKTTVKTKYKTFKNAVKVQIGKSSEKNYQYFVPNYGMVKDVKNGKTIEQLIRVGKQRHFE
ncbi:hypothetical protein [Rummeliibacillus sp. POC4]|uniref:hypothetical protein n=1 Tax=Rummeliibacillus sp. POC4 TaxID=2305899 RepID=UPI000E668859|nr:hypothetical protein [Rummeliibacillus sp. POC4]RIJ69384.1 hypothetical protein D1606_01060 [Rummeliibacillus sp. POC4]